MLRWRHGVVVLRSSLEEVLNTAHGKLPYMTRDIDDNQNDAMECAVDSVRTCVNIVVTDTFL